MIDEISLAVRGVIPGAVGILRFNDEVQISVRCFLIVCPGEIYRMPL